MEPFDVDLESLWTEFDAIPSLPPCPGFANYSDGGVSPYCQQEFHCPLAKSTTRVECFFDANTAVGRYSFWTGPDPLCPYTCADDLFLYTTTFLFLDDFQWLEFRLCKLRASTQEVLAQYPFFLPRVESLLGNLRRTREQIKNILSHAAFAGNTDYCFQLIICPIPEPMYCKSGTELSSLPHVRPSSVVEPQNFVKNIMGNLWLLSGH